MSDSNYLHDMHQLSTISTTTNSPACADVQGNRSSAMTQSDTFQPNPALRMAKEKAKSEFRTLKQQSADTASKTRLTNKSDSPLRSGQHHRQK
jgi:hypothetical protein